jgi:hypothetical protein
MKDLFSTDMLTDVTLACGGQESILWISVSAENLENILALNLVHSSVRNNRNSFIWRITNV